MPNEVLKQIIEYSYNNVPYYQKLFNDNDIDISQIDEYQKLANIPVLTKDIIQGNPSAFISEEYHHHPKSSELVIKRTSGSTGKYLKIYWSKKDEVRSMLQLWLKRSRFHDVSPEDRFCTFHTTMYSQNKLVEAPEEMMFYGGRAKSFSKLNLDEMRLAQFYDMMIEFEPTWLFIQPSIAYILAQYIESNKLEVPKSIKYIELTGEYLFEEYRQKIIETFKVPISNQYGCNEINGIAYECPYGHLHVLENNVLVEVLKDGENVIGEPGDIYITGLTNRAMPFIRYAIGDRGILHNDIKCDCGIKSPILEVLTGRTSDYISLDNDEKSNSYIFLYPIERINEDMGYPVKQFKVIQNDINDFTVCLSLKESFKGWKKSISQYFIEKVSDIGFSNVNWSFDFVDNIYPDSETGKLSFFENRIREGN